MKRYQFLSAWLLAVAFLVDSEVAKIYFGTFSLIALCLSAILD